MRELKKGQKHITFQKGVVLRLPFDLNQIRALFGQQATCFNEQIDDYEKFFMQYDGQTYKLAQLP